MRRSTVQSCYWAFLFSLFFLFFQTENELTTLGSIPFLFTFLLFFPHEQEEEGV